jgi:hypothetical protein
MSTFIQDDSIQGTTTTITEVVLGGPLYAYNTNLSSLSSYSYLNINNLNATSTTTFNNLNSLSTNSVLSINNLNNTSTTILNFLNSLSTQLIQAWRPSPLPAQERGCLRHWRLSASVSARHDLQVSVSNRY